MIRLMIATCIVDSTVLVDVDTTRVDVKSALPVDVSLLCVLGLQTKGCVHHHSDAASKHCHRLLGYDD